MMEKRINEITVAQSIAITLVVYGHCMPRATNNPEWLVWQESFIYSFHMPLFMFISGYLFIFSSVGKPLLSGRIYLAYVLKKAQRLLMPYLCLGSCGFLFKAIAAQYSFRPFDFSWRFYLIGLLYPNESAVQMYWFLMTLFIIFLYAPIFKYMMEQTHWLLTTAQLGTFAVAYIYNRPDAIAFINLSGVVDYTFFFFLGAWVCHFFGGRTELLSNPFLIVTLIGVLVLAQWLPALEGQRWVQLFTAVVGIACIWSLAHFLYKVHIHPLQTIYGYSYQIFLLSWFVQNPIRILYQMNITGYHITLLLMFAGGLFVPVFITKLVERKAPANMRVFFGRLLGFT
jgi:fucose 4-O-acetylase-like acetyltransferase